MKIDIDPNIIEAVDFWKTVLELRQIDALYVIRLANGEDYSVEFDEKSLEEFHSNKTVSEVLAILEDGVKRNYEECLKAVETGIHPNWTVTKRIMHPIAHTWTGKTEEVPYTLSENEKDSFKNQAEKWEKKMGKMTFNKICISPSF